MVTKSELDGAVRAVENMVGPVLASIKGDVAQQIGELKAYIDRCGQDSSRQLPVCHDQDMSKGVLGDGQPVQVDVEDLSLGSGSAQEFHEIDAATSMTESDGADPPMLDVDQSLHNEQLRWSWWEPKPWIPDFLDAANESHTRTGLLAAVPPPESCPDLLEDRDDTGSDTTANDNISDFFRGACWQADDFMPTTIVEEDDVNPVLLSSMGACFGDLPLLYTAAPKDAALWKHQQTKVCEHLSPRIQWVQEWFAFRGV
jgi:hypothetical protein